MANVRAMGSSEARLGPGSFSENGTYNASSENLDGYNTVEVSVPQPAVGDKFIFANGTYNSQTLDNMYGYREVQVLVPQPPLIERQITANGEYTAADQGVYGYSSVLVNVPPNVGMKNITANGQYNASADGLDGYSSVNVSVPSSAVVGPKTITMNGTYYANQEVPALDGFNQVTVNIPLGTKNITENGTYIATTSGVQGFSQVTVNVPPTFTETSLWTNPNTSTTAAFAGQTVNLSDNISNYKYLAFLYCLSSGEAGRLVTQKVIISTEEFAETTYVANNMVVGLTCTGTTSGNNYFWTRAVYYASGTSVTFSGARTVYNTVEQNSRVYPLEILGLN